MKIAGYSLLSEKKCRPHAGSMDLWDYDVRSHPDTPSTFANLASLCRHYETLLPRDRIDERIEAEKAVFIIRRESSLEDTMRQFLRRIELVLQADIQGLPIPAPPIYPPKEVFRPQD